MGYFKVLSGIVVVVAISVTALAQTGPAGVGTSANNVLWLKADAGTSTTTAGAAVSGWNDQSGNAIDVSQTVAPQQPLYQTNVINGFPALQFDNVATAGQNDRLVGPDSPLLDNTAGYSFFTISRPQTLGTNSIVSKRTGVSIEQSFMLFYWSANKFNVDIQTTNDRFESTVAFSNSTNYLLDVIYDGTLPMASRSKFYVGESLNRVAAETNSFVPDNNSPLLIGSTDMGDARPFAGYIPEVIIYREALNKASRIIVNNYLSAKYDIALTANDKYAGDTPANGDYDREVAGIGTDTIQPGGTIGSNTAFAASISGGLGISAVSGFEPGDYILAGHATLTNAAIQTDITGLSGGANSCRWKRIWYVDVTNTGTLPATNIEFDLSDGGVTPTLSTAVASDYVLLYRPAQTGTWTEMATANTLTGDKIRFNGYVLVSDGYYTIGSHNCFASPLPVELVDFSAQNAGRDVQLSWSTATELNNDEFTVEHSTDGVSFDAVCTVPGAGNSTSLLHYSCMHISPGSGIHYYRLKQTDINGVFTYSGLVSVLRDDETPAFTIYPNPNNGTFHVAYSGPDESTVTVQITDPSDPSGRTVAGQTLTGKELRETGITLSGTLTAGSYIVRFSVDETVQVVRIVVG